MNLRDLVRNKLAKKQYINNPDGSISTERQVSFGTDDGFYSTPSIINGVQHSPKDAIQMSLKDLASMQKFPTEQDAVQYGQRRSHLLGFILKRLKEHGQY